MNFKNGPLPSEPPNLPLNSDPACIAFRSLSSSRFPGSAHRLGAGGAGYLPSLGRHATAVQNPEGTWNRGWRFRNLLCPCFRYLPLLPFLLAVHLCRSVACPLPFELAISTIGNSFCRHCSHSGSQPDGYCLPVRQGRSSGSSHQQWVCHPARYHWLRLHRPKPSIQGNRDLPLSGYVVGLTLRSTRTPPALPPALSQLLASSASLSTSVQTGPVSFIR